MGNTEGHLLKLEQMNLPASGRIFNVAGVGHLLAWGIVAGGDLDGDAGYAPGGLYINTAGADGTNAFINDGTAASADFNLIVVTAA